jgi:malonate-semialdehyde dehydrogenase (acetylating) / methylmalonate-semialdehyde dehydrogenase
MRTTENKPQILRNFINGEWIESSATESMRVVNPATQELLATVPLSSGQDVAAAIDAASAAFPAWRHTPPPDRIQFLFKLKDMLETHLEELARIITTENGKTLAESRAELRRGIENVEVACGIPSLMQGYNLENVASGIDEIMIRQPLGVVGIITPFNFPGMIPLWFLPYAIACGNTVVIKPSEKVPRTLLRISELLYETGLPRGVVNVVVGAKDAVDGLLDHPKIRAISFVGSTPVARYIYARAAATGKRVQAQGGAKNFVVIMPDADMDLTSKIVSDGAFGCAGQRCLAISSTIMVGDAQHQFQDLLVEKVRALNVGNGLDENAHVGPVITPESKKRINQLISAGIQDGAKPLVDGRHLKVPGHENGNFLGPTILEGLSDRSPLNSTEIFGPVLNLGQANTLDDAIEAIPANPYGNAASIFTSSGAAARKFRSEVTTGNVGVNIGVAAPMAYFPFSGWKDSFFGILHGQGRDGVEFYTDQKVVIERWPKEWSRKF